MGGEKKKGVPRDAGGETSADTNLVNALESDPEFFKDALIGRQLGKCRIQKLLGEGKTAVVYQAIYEPLNRTVAVKVLQEHMKKLPAVVKVFQQEGRAVAALDHENILKIYDVGEAQGHHYLVLELLRGKTLLKVIEEAGPGKLPVKEALGYLRQAAAGLAAAHRKNLVHRDIKPQNLVVEPDGTLKIVDFGLAAEAEGAFSGGRLGTPHYMSTEQCRGEMAGTASDIYALGITLYHMLVGHPPYAGKLTTDAIIAEHLAGKRLEPEKLRPGLSKAVADLIRRMTRSEMSARPTAQEIRDALAKSKTEKGPTTGAVRRSRAARSARRRTRSKSSAPGLLVLGCVVAVCAILVALIAGRGGGPDRGEKKSNSSGRSVSAEPRSSGSSGSTAKPDGDADARNRAVTELLREARSKEQTKDWRGALGLYQKVLLRAPSGSTPYKRAKAAARSLQERIDSRKHGVKPKPLRRFISVEASEAAGKEFSAGRAVWRSRLGRLEAAAVKAEMEPFLARTRENSPEHGAIQLAIRRAGYIERIVNMCVTRVQGLSGGKELWSVYDYQASSDLIVAGATSKGLMLRNVESGETKRLTWAAIDTQILVTFIDAVRSGESTAENLWMAYLCQLLGDDRADQYFEFAQFGDPSAEIKAEIKALRGGR